MEGADSPALLVGCAVTAALLTRIAEPEQALLAASLLAGCVWALIDRKRAAGSWAAIAIYALATAGLAQALRRAVRGPLLLSVAALASLALHASRLPRLLPASQFLPWSALLLLALGAAAGGPEARSVAGLAIGRVDGWPLAWAVLCAVLSTAALAAWSLCWVRGDHGPIQKVLGPIMKPELILVFALVNAIGEELEFRMLVFGGLVGDDALGSSPGLGLRTRTLWVALAVVLQAAFFATLHVAGGFPSGASGGLLVFVWAVFLGILRLWASGMLLVLLLHVQADLVIFVLVYAQERRRRWRRVSTELGEAPPPTLNP